MNLRDCTALQIDHVQETFTYVFPDRAVVRPIIRPEMVPKVAALLEYAGADIQVVREESETKGKKTMNESSKLTLKNSTLNDRLKAIADGCWKEIHGAAVAGMAKEGLCKWAGDKQDYVLTDAGRDVLGIAHPAAESANGHSANGHVNAPSESRPVVRDAGLIESGVLDRMREKLTAAPNLILPAPSKQEQAMRRAAYASIRWGLQRALSGGEALVPVLDGLEATDPYLSGTDKDGPR